MASQNWNDTEKISVAKNWNDTEKISMGARHPKIGTIQRRSAWPRGKQHESHFQLPANCFIILSWCRLLFDHHL